MDGAGVLFDTKDPAARRRADGRDRLERRPPGRDRRRPDRGASTACRPRTSPARCSASSNEILGAPRAPAPRVAFDFWHQFDAARSARGAAGCTGRRSTKRCRRAVEAMIVNQWVPAAHRGDAIGDSARRVRDAAAATWATTSELFALTIDDELRGDVRPFADPGARRGDVTIFHYALPSPMTEAFASPERRARAPVPQRDAGARSSRRTIRSSSASPRSAGRNSPRSSAGSIWRSATRNTTGRSSKRWASRRPASSRSPSTPTASRRRVAGRRSKGSWTTGS